MNTKSILRWIACLPAAVAGVLIVPVIIDLLNSFAPDWWRGSIMSIIKDAGGGVAFVVFGALTAPRFQFQVSIVLAICYAILGTYLAVNTTHGGSVVAHIIVSILGATGATAYVKQRNSQQPEA